MPEINLIDFFTYYKGEPHQKEAVQLLQSAMPESLLKNKASWVVKWRETPEPAPDCGLPPDAVALICEFEGFVPYPYNDGVGVATIGYGSTFYLDGRRVDYSDPPIGEPEARQMMEAIAKKNFWDVLKTTIPNWEEMSLGQQGALLSFAYNLGAHFYGSPGFATVSACLRDRAWNEIPDAFRLYVNPGTAVEAGLRRRREAEIRLWNS